MSGIAAKAHPAALRVGPVHLTVSDLHRARLVLTRDPSRNASRVRTA